MWRGEPAVSSSRNLRTRIRKKKYPFSLTVSTYILTISRIKFHFYSNSLNLYTNYLKNKMKLLFHSHCLNVYIHHGKNHSPLSLWHWKSYWTHYPRGLLNEKKIKYTNWPFYFYIFKNIQSISAPEIAPGTGVHSVLTSRPSCSRLHEIPDVSKLCKQYKYHWHRFIE